MKKSLLRKVMCLVFALTLALGSVSIVAFAGNDDDQGGKGGKSSSSQNSQGNQGGNSQGGNGNSQK